MRLRSLRFQGLTTIRSRAALCVAALSVLLIAVVSAVQLQSMRHNFQQLLTAQQTSIVDYVADDVDAGLRQDIDILQRHAERVPVDSLHDAERLRALLTGDASLLSMFDDVLVLDATGEITADVPRLPGRTALNAADREFFQRVMRTGEPVVSEPLMSKLRRVPIVNVAVPIRDKEGRIAGVLAGVLRLTKDNVLGSLATAKVGRTGYFAVITRGSAPVYVVHPDRERILQARPAKGRTSAVDAALSATSSGTVEDVNSRGVRALFTYRALRSVDWLLVAVFPTEEAYAPIVAAERELLGLAIAAAVLVAVLTWLLIDRLLAPLTRLREHLHAQRRAAHSQPAPVERSDEIGELASAFNALIRDRLSYTEALAAHARDLRLAAAVFDTTADAVVISDADDRILMVNPAFSRLTGHAAADVVGRVLAESAFAPLDPAQSAERMAIQRRQGYVTAEVMRHHKDGRELPLWVTASNVTDERGDITHFVRVFTDISHLKRSQRALEDVAKRDGLTGLLNRRAFDEHLRHALARGSGNGAVTLLFVDLDAFKAVNDTLGHELGDELLRAVAARLRKCLRDIDALARFGGDEFAIVLEADRTFEASNVAARIVAACAQPFVLAGHTVQVRASIGVASYPADANDVAALLRAADAAMYEAKRAGGDRFVQRSVQASKQMEANAA